MLNGYDESGVKIDETQGIAQWLEYLTRHQQIPSSGASQVTPTVRMSLSHNSYLLLNTHCENKLLT